MLSHYMIDYLLSPHMAGNRESLGGQMSSLSDTDLTDTARLPSLPLVLYNEYQHDRV